MSQPEQGQPRLFAQLPLLDGILEQHRVQLGAGTEGELVDMFRQADWVDVTGGFITASIPKGFLADVFALFPNAGFHRCLLRLTCRHAVLHPLKPLPMIRW